MSTFDKSLLRGSTIEEPQAPVRIPTLDLFDARVCLQEIVDGTSNWTRTARTINQLLEPTAAPDPLASQIEDVRQIVLSMVTSPADRKTIAAQALQILDAIIIERNKELKSLYIPQLSA